MTPLVRFAMAAGMYLLLMWGYVVLPNAQMFAAFLALMMSVMLMVWGGKVEVEGVVEKAVRDSSHPDWTRDIDAPVEQCSEGCAYSEKDQARLEHLGVTMNDWQDRINASARSAASPEHSQEYALEASVLRLDALKAELKLHYAQFGRDQALINSKGLGSWHSSKNPRDN